MKQLAAARAVITIWTKNSVQSDWVRAEAGRAKADGKLIPVKTPELTYGDIPLPFGEMHTENISSLDLIRAAVVAQFAKPAVEPTAWALLTKGFKYELLKWVGIVGGALTLFTNLGAVLKFADWARLLVQGWKEWTHAFWVWAFGWLGIHLPPEWPPVLSFLLFCLLLTIGPAVQSFNRETLVKQLGHSTVESVRLLLVFQRRFEQIRWWRLIPIIVGLIFMSLLVDIVFDFATRTLPFLAPLTERVWLWFISGAEIMVFFAAMLLIPIVARDKLHSAVAICLLVTFWTIITFNQLITMPDTEGTVVEQIAFAMILFLPAIPLSVAPAKAISRRLIFLGLGLLLLIALNELSELGVDLTAPKLQG
jgi:hypothetical protein